MYMTVQELAHAVDALEHDMQAVQNRLETVAYTLNCVIACLEEVKETLVDSTPIQI